MQPVVQKNLVRADNKRSSGASMVVVDYSSKNVAPTNWAIAYKVLQSDGNVLAKSLMWPRLVVKVDICNQNLLQVTRTEDKQLVKTLLAYRADPTLGKGIGLRCLRRG